MDEEEAAPSWRPVAASLSHTALLVNMLGGSQQPITVSVALFHLSRDARQTMLPLLLIGTSSTPRPTRVAHPWRVWVRNAYWKLLQLIIPSWAFALALLFIYPELKNKEGACILSKWHLKQDNNKKKKNTLQNNLNLFYCRITLFFYRLLTLNTHTAPIRCTKMMGIKQWLLFYRL